MQTKSEPEWRVEGRIGCGIMMIGTALATLSSVSGLGLVNHVGAIQTLVMGVFVIAMVFWAGRVMVDGKWIHSVQAVGVGLAATLSGWVMVDHFFLIAFPGTFALTAFLSLACAKRRPPPMRA